ncbi:hypothetical protein GCM10017044_25420 [Kordiimonas sediminis]|uniref:Flagellar protein FliL n=1 Tax=Kordiimonas sediminis TaxID=1735581 RepID=A0A919EA28_9PROT|nr:hypothetical protein [Kordiimonas sediminis]GHF29083.1 hypothetical protein GCM10017044_25420 [Kordiimonas sediminis]
MSEENEKGESSGSSKLLLIVGLVLGLGIGGAAVFFLMPEDDGSETQEVAEVTAPEDLQVVEFKEVLIPIYIKRDGRSVFIGNYTVDLSIEVDGTAAVDKVTSMESRLKHEFIATISTVNLMREDSGAELDFEKASKVLKEKAEAVVGKGVIYDLTVTKAMRISR